jgi:glycolate oxidase iron-sulfur subunit
VTIPDDRDAADRCHRCGACLPVCPVYRETGTETTAPRGKLAVSRLAAEGGSAATIGACLLCGRCARACPSGIEVDEAIRAARADHVRSGGPSLPARFARLATADPARSDRAARALRAVQDRLTARGVADDAGLRFRSPLPRLAPRFFLESGDLRIPATRHGAPRVALFVGCSFNYLDPRVAASMVGAIAASGAEVAVPAGQGCCGLPALGLGDEQAARRRVRENARVLLAGDPDHLVTACASCASMIARHGPSLAPDDPHSPAAAFSRKILGVWEWLDRFTPAIGFAEGRPLEVTYHAPCHLGNDADAPRRARECLAALPHVRLVAMDEDACCGGGGSFTVTHPRLSAAIADRRARAIVRTGASLVATDCFGCAIRIRSALGRIGARAGVVHPVELFDPARVEALRTTLRDGR